MMSLQILIFPFFSSLVNSREPRTLYIDPRSEGDCFKKPCSMSTASRNLRTADTIHFPENYKILPTSYPSEFSDLVVQLSLHNTTVVSHGTIVDGSMLAGEHCVELVSHPFYTWTVFVDWKFINFEKPLFLRDQTWSNSPYIVFKNCVFENCNTSIFKLAGGMFIFENCVFQNISGYPIHGEYHTHLEFVECRFENCKSLFLRKSDAIFTNCVFKSTFGDRGGAIYADRSTVHIDHCFFINTKASINGGAIYFRDIASQYETEILNSCFVGTSAEQNGTALYLHKSNISISNTCLRNKDVIHSHQSNINSTRLVYNDLCEDFLKSENVEVIPERFDPEDTFKLWELDDLKDGTTISIEDDYDFNIDI